ncbi:hypothetical protein BJB45_02335 [Halomonas huangheensis]|uniref:Uncharacterized protein n=1 Tax=Halomonas huangheensis TaxID=1178482 RepID=W1N3C4_9GAMM|nr:hypothetical protein BJB45_02335 [Halomonas huangheensis]
MEGSRLTHVVLSQQALELVFGTELATREMTNLRHPTTYHVDG